VQPKPGRRRLDERLVADGLADSRTLAQAFIRSGRVLVDDVPHDKPGTRISDAAAVRLRGPAKRYVSRGGDKLAAALAALGVPVEGRHCLDVGSSTGGFTDCLLQHGARHVVALDVGYGQLHEKLRQDARVTSVERTNARTLGPTVLPGPDPLDLVTIDASFISATLLLPRVAAAAPLAEILVLVKPQFEVGRGEVGKGGVVRDEGLRARAADDVQRCAEAQGYAVLGRVDSELAGPKGNREIFLWLGRRPADQSEREPDAGADVAGPTRRDWK